jgi:hypothetical protein
MLNLGVLEREEGKLSRARRWYEQAIGTGHPDQASGAMFDLGNLERREGNLDSSCDQRQVWSIGPVRVGMERCATC